jgi:hypothetical protein
MSRSLDEGVNDRAVMRRSSLRPPAAISATSAASTNADVERHRSSGVRANGHATMRVKIAGAVPMVDASGDVMDRSETVTLFNDMCLLAPGTLLDRNIVWEPVDRRTVRARFTNGTQTITATLLFNDDGLLADFVSDDRSRSSPDGKVFTRLRFSTPVRDYRDFGGVRLAAHGEARWSLPEEEFTYGEFELVSVSYNMSSRQESRPNTGRP